MSYGGAVTVLRDRAAPLRVAAVTAAGVAVDAAVDPHTTHVPLCPLHALTGLQCPLCGSLRAVHDLTRLRLGDAIHDNVLLVAGVPLALAFWVLWLVQSGPRRPVLPRTAAVAIVLIAAGFFVLRNTSAGAALRPQ